jgi:hypothetical protein
VLFEGIQGGFVTLGSIQDYYTKRRAVRGLSKMYNSVFIIQRLSPIKLFIGVLKNSSTKLICGPPSSYSIGSELTQPLFTNFVRSSKNIFSTGRNYYRVVSLDWPEIFRTCGIKINLRPVMIYLKKSEMQMIGDLNRI